MLTFRRRHASSFDFQIINTKLVMKKQNNMRYKFIILLLLLFGYHAQAQETQRNGWEIEADPLAYILKGYSLHAAITYGNFRSSVGVFAIDQPSFLRDNDNFSVYTSGFDVKTDYLFGSLKGFYAGLQVSYGKDKIELKGGDEKRNLWGLNVGPRAGYRFLFGNKQNQYKGFYINSWIALLYSPNAKTIQMGTQSYKQSSWFPFPAVHIGWRW